MDFSLNSQNITDKKILNRIENLCTQEEPAACIAACPLHVNIKDIINHITKEEWVKAYELFLKTIPFPEIIAHACDAPCMGTCRRKEIGGAIDIGKLEIAILDNYKMQAKSPLFLPKKAHTIAIIGGGLSGMTCAMDLIKKGYKVKIYEKENRLGGKLWGIDREVLSAEAIEEDIKRLLKFPVEVFYENFIPCKTKEEVLEFKEKNSYDAVYIACETDLKNDGDTLITEVKDVFSGKRKNRLTDGFSPIYDMFDGKSAATSLERSLQNVSIMAGREKEGSFETTLFTDVASFSNEAPIKSSGKSYTKEEALKEARRCIQCTCLECVKSCSFMQHYKAYPKRYVRELYNNLSIAMGIHHANEMINACSLCGQCGLICPNGLNMADTFLAARNKMVESKKMPPSVFEFAMLDMEYSVSHEAFMVKNQKGFEKSEYLFFPGCQLSASEPDLVKQVYKDLCEKLSGGVGLMLSCCGIMAHWGGDKDKFQKAIDEIKTSWIKLNSPKIIVSCPNCQRVLSDMAHLPVINIYELFHEIELDDLKNFNDENYYIHDACGARNDKNTQDKVRSLIKNIGCNVCEMKDNKDKGSCCGYGGLALFSNKTISDEIISKNIKDNSLDMNDAVLTYCINCRDRYLSKGVKSYHILEKIYEGRVRINGKSPTWSLRQENRAYLKNSILNEVWGEKIEMSDDIEIYLDDKLIEKLEDRMILKSDIKNVIKYGEEKNNRFYNPENKHFTASLRPQNVTFWVEYEPFKDGFLVHNAYSHRMSFENLNIKSGSDKT